MTKEISMSGGHFDYMQHHINDIAQEIEHIIETNGSIDDYGCEINYSEEIIEEFKKGIKALKIAEIYAQRIDWLLSGDDGEENFFKRLKKELEQLENG